MTSIFDRTTDAQAGCAVCVDGGGNVFAARVQNERATNRQYVVIENFTGQEVHRTEVVAEEGLKVDAVAICVAGADLLVYTTAHSPNPADPDHHWDGQFHTVSGVCVPYAAGHAPLGAQLSAQLPEGSPNPGPQPEPTPGGGTGPVSDTDIQKIVAQTIAALKSEFGGNVRAGIQTKAKDGAIEAFGEGTMAAPVYNQLRNVIYGVLVENGVIKPKQGTIVAATIEEAK